MFLKHQPSGDLVEILQPQELWNPYVTHVQGRFHAGEELQDPEQFTKAHLIFLSGESLPVCWCNPGYRQPTKIMATAVRR